MTQTLAPLPPWLISRISLLSVAVTPVAVKLFEYYYCHLNFRYGACFLAFKQITECRLTLKLVRV